MGIPFSFMISSRINEVKGMNFRKATYERLQDRPPASPFSEIWSDFPGQHALMELSRKNTDPKRLFGEVLGAQECFVQN